MTNDYDINNITLDNLRNATLILESDDKFMLMPMRDIKYITRLDDFADFTTSFDIKCARYSGGVRVLQKGIDVLGKVDTEFASSEELENFLSQFQRSELNA